MKQCPKCQKTYPEETKFCPSCGGATVTPEEKSPPQAAGVARYCTKCGAACAADTAFCPKCGTPMTTEKAIALKRPAAPAGAGMPMYAANAMGSADDVYVPDHGVMEMFFRRDNRLNRQRYLMRIVVMLIVIAVVGTALGQMFAQFALASPSMDIDTIISIGRLISVVLYLLTVPTCLRRLHDLNHPSWLCVLVLIPYLQWVLILYLLAAKGTDGPNQYGPDPLTTSGVV